MLPADRALTSRLLATSKLLRWPTIGARCRSDHARDNRWTIGRAPTIRRGSRLGSLQSPDPRTNDSTARASFLKSQNFIPWLIARLQTLEKNSANPGYATFARNLTAILPNKSIQIALENQNSTHSKQSQWQPSEQTRPLSLLKSLRTAYNFNGESGVDLQLRYAYHGLLAARKFSKLDVQDQERLADLRYPVEWYPATRAIQRKIIMHVGPTNSGKTYHALKRLEQAKTGIYAGPLRLLAHEVYTRLNAKGKICDLVTGDEKAVQENAEMRSCTVEMVPLNVDVDVAVIDEIQMIGHKERGWAWTQAFLGLKAKEIHLCGEERSIPLIRELAASMGDELEINTYKRLSPLKTMSTSLHGDLRNLRKGDCVVVFSRLGIRAMKADIERLTRKRVAIVYGSLPPEIRAQQAKLFNDPDNDYDFLVASDAIGMGLNLAIKRIIFETVQKYNGFRIELIEPAHLKQIAGRAGRYRTAAQAEGPDGSLDKATAYSRKPLMQIPSPNVGLVTTLEAADLPIVQRAMQTELDPIMSAGILPPTTILMKFATYFPPSTSFSYILLRLHELSLKHPRYHLCTLKDQIGIADVIQAVRLTIHDRIIFCASPCSVREQGMAPILQAYARCVGENTSGALLDIPEIPLEILDEEMRLERGYMSSLENLHKALVLYLWLSYRFAGVFINQAMAFYVKRLVEEKIDKMLAEYSSSPAIREKIRRIREEALRQISKLNEPVAKPNNSQAQIEMPDTPLVPDDDVPAQGPEGQESYSADPHIAEQRHGIDKLAEATSGASPQ